MGSPYEGGYYEDRRGSRRRRIWYALRGHKRRPRSRKSRCDGCDGPCDGCDVCGFPLLSMTLLAVATLVPDAGTTLVSRAIAGYQRWLTRFTVACPSTPSCSAYAAAAVREHGARHGLRLAAARLRRCG